MNPFLPFDAENTLFTAVKSVTTAVDAYDTLGRRRPKTDNGGTTAPRSNQGAFAGQIAIADGDLPEFTLRRSLTLSDVSKEIAEMDGAGTRCAIRL